MLYAVSAPHEVLCWPSGGCDDTEEVAPAPEKSGSRVSEGAIGPV